MPDAADVFDGFVAAAAATDPSSAEEMHRYADTVNALPEARSVLERALTAASRAVSLSTGEEPRTSLIKTGDDAHAELDRFRPIGGPDAPEMLMAFAEAFSTATDRLGPLPGGLKGLMGADPRRSNDGEVEPTSEEAIAIAHLSGKVVGMASAERKIDALAEVRLLVEGCPICGRAVELTGTSHQQLGPGTGPAKVGGQCAQGHISTRPEGVVVPWETVSR